MRRSRQAKSEQGFSVTGVCMPARSHCCRRSYPTSSIDGVFGGLRGETLAGVDLCSIAGTWVGKRCPSPQAAQMQLPHKIMRWVLRLSVSLCLQVPWNRFCAATFARSGAEGQVAAGRGAAAVTSACHSRRVTSPCSLSRCAVHEGFRGCSSRRKGRSRAASRCISANYARCLAS